MEAANRLRGSDLNAALTKALAGIRTDHLDSGPASTIAFHRGNVVVAVMHNALTKTEKALVQNGGRRDISEFRRLSRWAMEPDLRAAVERLTGRTVVAFLGADQLEPDVEAEIFILDAPL